MPVTDLSDDDQDWLQQYLAGHMAGQAYGANQPYGPGGAPGPYSGGPQGQMPGGGVMNRLQTTPGAPSMGYPGMGQPTAQQPPAAAPGLLGRATTAGLSLNSNPIANWLRNNVSIGAPNFANAVNPDFFHDAGVAQQKLAALGGALPSSADAAPYLANAPTSGYTPMSPPPSPAATSTANPAPAVKRTDAAYGPYNAPPGAAPIDPYEFQRAPPSAAAGGNPAKKPAAFTGAAPGSGNPTGSPSQTPAVAGSQSPWNRFVQIDRPNAPPQSGGMARGGAPQMTALNLAGLFGGGAQQPQPVTNPNVPAAAAQPVSGQAPVMGPLAPTAAQAAAAYGWPFNMLGRLRGSPFIPSSPQGGPPINFPGAP